MNTNKLPLRWLRPDYVSEPGVYLIKDILSQDEPKLTCVWKYPTDEFLVIKDPDTGHWHDLLEIDQDRNLLFGPIPDWNQKR